MDQPHPETRFTEPGSFNIPVGSLPPGDIFQDADAPTVAAKIAEKLNQAFQSQDVKTIAALFYEKSIWRDHLALSWDLRTLKGRNAIHSMLQQDCRITRLYIDNSSPFRAAKLQTLDSLTTIQFYHTFTTKFGVGRGIIRLVSIDSEWTIWTMFTSLQELTGFEEKVARRRPEGHEQRINGKNWKDMRQEEFAFETTHPTVLIIGAGQAGLTLSARLKMLNIPSLCIDVNAVVGDNWRSRYHDLVLHDPVWYDHLPYVPFPANWPTFTPKDKLADFFEAYVKILELNVWTRTQVKAWTWDENRKQWSVTLETVTCEGDCITRTIYPSHVVQATGQSGQKKMPTVPGMDQFAGTIMHSSDFRGAKEGGQGKRAVVIGACNSAHDICQDFWNKQYDVTMIQRSSTAVVTPAAIAKTSWAGLYEEGGPPVEDADLMVCSMPAEVAKAVGQRTTQAQKQLDAHVLEGLTKAGFQLNFGPDNAGLYMSYLQRGGGYYIDVGTSALIVDGKIKVKSGCGVSEILPRAIRLADGTELPADEIVFATGYQNMRSQTRQIFGDSLADQVKDVWGLDSEGEIRGMWRRTSHPGFWFMGGNLSICRYYSRVLALQIKAVHEGLVE